MKKISFIFITILYLIFSNSIFSNTLNKKIIEYSTVFKGTNEDIAYITDSKNINLMEQLLKNLDLFNQENNKLNSFKISNIEIMPKDKSFSNLLITAERTQQNFNFHFSYNIHEISINDNNQISEIKFTEENLKDKKKSYFTIINQKFDDKNNLLKRIVIQAKEKSEENLPNDYKEFINGKIIEYLDYNAAYFPSKVIIKNFILNSTGEIIIVKIQESLNRAYNNKGFLTKETSKLTEYPFSKAVPFFIYNLKINSDFNIESYDVIFPQNNVINEYSENYNVIFNQYKNSEFAKKIIRKFSFNNATKIFISGKTIEKDIVNDKNIKTSENSFEIKEGTDGLKVENRIYKSSRDFYNLSFDDIGKVLNSNVIDYDYIINNDNTKTIKIFKSLKKITYTFDKTALKSILVSLFLYGNDKKLNLTKKLNININDFDKTGKPISFSIKSETPNNQKAEVDKIINQNIEAELQDAIYEFKYFIFPSTNFYTEVKKVSERGEIEEVFFTDKK